MVFHFQGSSATSPVSPRHLPQNGYSSPGAVPTPAPVPTPTAPAPVPAPTPHAPHATWTGSSTLTYTQSAPADAARPPHHHAYCESIVCMHSFASNKI